MGVTSAYRQAEFASAEELERELRRLDDSEEFPELVGFDAHETPFIAFLELVSATPDGQPTMHPRAALLTGERSDLIRIEEEAGVGQLAYPVRVLTRPGS